MDTPEFSKYPWRLRMIGAQNMVLVDAQFVERADALKHFDAMNELERDRNNPHMYTMTDDAGITTSTMIEAVFLVSLFNMPEAHRRNVLSNVQMATVTEQMERDERVRLDAQSPAGFHHGHSKSYQ